MFFVKCSFIHLCEGISHLIYIHFFLKSSLPVYIDLHFLLLFCLLIYQTHSNGSTSKYLNLFILLVLQTFLRIIFSTMFRIPCTSLIIFFIINKCLTCSHLIFNLLKSFIFCDICFSNFVFKYIKPKWNLQSIKRNFMFNIFQHWSVPDRDIPPTAPKGKYGKVILKPKVSLLNAPHEMNSVKSMYPLTFEELNQSYGFVLYETELSGRYADPALLSIPILHDRAIVYLNMVKNSINFI